MKTYLLFFAICLCQFTGFTQDYQWAWMGGETNYTGVNFGIKGVADSTNYPPARIGVARWKDASGNFWILGGSGINDLWKYDPATKWWTWVIGDSVPSLKAVYGTRGVASPANRPGAPNSYVSWTDASGNVWMYADVLWKYNPATNQWAWINGDTSVTKAVYGRKGVADAANKPGTTNSVEWTDTNGNFWLYGDVLWKYNVSTDMWTWVQGDTTNTKTVYGLKGLPNSTNTPGTRRSVTGWKDASGKFWLFGGYGTVSSFSFFYTLLSNSGNLNDLWSYDPATNQWAWMSGDTLINASGNTGTIGSAAPGNRPAARMNAVSWTDSSGNLWLFGGYKNNGTQLPYTIPMNDLWKYNTTTNLWTCLTPLTYYLGQDAFTVKGVESPYTIPACRSGATGWTDSSGNLWLFGGTTLVYQQSITYLPLNDLLRFNPKTNLWSLERENKDGKVMGRYGTKGMVDMLNIPGGRFDAASTVDSAGNLWLFGGIGYDTVKPYPRVQRDLWKKDTAGLWTWVGGTEVPSPPARSGATFWTDANDQLWLFGGRNDQNTNINDLWRFNKNTSKWTLVSGNSNAVYGIKGQYNAINKPGARSNAISFSDRSGKLWLFGGDGNYIFNNPLPNEYNDLWNYDPAINQWTWLSGDSVRGQPWVFGKPGIPDAANKPRARQGAVSWADTLGNIWIFGGRNNDIYTPANNIGFFFNDLWKFSTKTNVWTWVSGDSAVNQKGVYGKTGTPDPANKPGARYEAVSWIDATGKLLLFGGRTLAGQQSTGQTTVTLNDLWTYDPSNAVWTWVSGDSVINRNGAYRTQGTFDPGNTPGARGEGIAWKDKAGGLWLMGGSGYGVIGEGALNDIWKLNPAAPLPVKYISFSAVPQNKTVVLNWQTVNEQQSSYYTILRSRDSARYDSIGTVMATGGLSTTNNYMFIDRLPFTDVNYYRIRQADKQGNYTYSIIRKVVTDNTLFSYTLGQNPVTNALTVYIHLGEPAKWQMEMRDVAGHLLIRQSQSSSPGTITNIIPVKQLATGAYFLTVTAGKTSITKTFIKY